MPPLKLDRAYTLTFTYTNWRGETRPRTVRVFRLWFGSTKWHPEPQWFLRGVEVGTTQAKDYATRDMRDVEEAA